MMNGCYVTDNAGVGVRICGGVRHNLPSKHDNHNHFARNLGGNEVDFRLTSMRAETNVKINGENSAEYDEKQYSQLHSKTIVANQSNNNRTQFQRDSSGSSFRKGDWWCQTCVPKIVVQGSKDSCPRCSSSKSRGIILPSEEILKLNRSGIWASYDLAKTTTKSSTNKSVLNKIRIKKTEGQHEVILNPAIISPTWWFDGDDAGWLPYDYKSNQKLESVFQSLRREKECSARSSGQAQTKNIVLLSEGRYSVNVETMEQINTTSQFLRLVQRREN